MNPNKSTTVARFLRTLAVSQAEPRTAIAYASGQNWADQYRIVTTIRAAAPALGSAASVLSPVGLDFADLVRPQTILGRLAGVRSMPFGCRLVGLTAATRAHFVKPGGAIPLSGVAFTQPGTIQRKMVAGILVASDELLREADPQVERALTADLVGATAAAIDETFVDVTNAGSDETPAAITYGGYSTSATGSTVDDIIDNLAGLAEELSDAGGDLTQCAWVLHPRTATFLAARRGVGGAPVFPGMGINGGELLGLPAIVSASVPVTADTSAETTISLIDGSGILLADEGEADISLSKHATLELDTEPTGDAITPTAQSTRMVSMFQANATAIKTARYLNWLPRRTTVAATLTGVTY